MSATEAIKEKLRDPAYLDLHLAAVGVLSQVGQMQWYDSNFLHRYEAAKAFLEQVRPDRLQEFVAAFDPLRPADNAQVVTIDNLFDAQTHARIRETARSIPEASLERHENELFGRHVVHDHPWFLELQRDLIPLVSDLLGREVETGYNFLSLYGPAGICDLHMDEPLSMYTLDYCIEQSDDWPIHFSRIVDWPNIDTTKSWSPEAMLEDPDLEFAPHTLKPNNALIFTGSSQWHYRRPIAPGGFCNLLFFHYYPKGCEGLVWPYKWAGHFDIPELQPFCDLIPKFERKDDQ